MKKNQGKWTCGVPMESLCQRTKYLVSGTSKGTRHYLIIHTNGGTKKTSKAQLIKSIKTKVNQLINQKKLKRNGIASYIGLEEKQFSSFY